MGPGSSVVERFLGKEKVGSSILLSGSSDIERHLVQASSSAGRAADSNPQVAGSTPVWPAQHKP